MPLNLLKTYPDLLELAYMSERQRRASLEAVFNRDFQSDAQLCFRGKPVRPFKTSDGQPALATLYHHLTTCEEDSEEGRKTRRRVFEQQRAERLHWVAYHLEERSPERLIIFSYEDRIDGRSVVRTYLYDKEEQYIIILQPYRTKSEYYLLTAYYLDRKYAKRQIEKKYKRRLNRIH